MPRKKELEIKKAGLKDFDQALELKLASKVEERRYNRELVPGKTSERRYARYLKNDLRDTWRAVFLARVKDKPVGLIVGKIYRTLKVAGYRRTGYISNLYVKKGFRRRGIAQALIKELTRWLKQKKATRITLELYEKNLPAQGLYAGLGYYTYCVKLRKKLR